MKRNWDVWGIIFEGKFLGYGILGGNPWKIKKKLSFGNNFAAKYLPYASFVLRFYLWEKVEERAQQARDADRPPIVDLTKE